MSNDKNGKVEIKIAPPNIQTAEFFIRGTAPLVIHKFSQKAIKAIRDKQELGSLANKNKGRAAKDFNDCFNQARHISTEGWDGFPAGAIRAAMIDACKLCGFKMTLAKLSIFVHADGFDNTEGTPLIRIVGPAPRQLESMVRIGIGGATTDIAVRAQWLEWGARLRIEFDADQFSVTDISNLLARVGMQVGICEGRPGSKNSAGMGWGTFRICMDESELQQDEGKVAK